MAPRKRSSILTAEPVQESSSKKRKTIKKSDACDKESKGKSQPNTPTSSRKRSELQCDQAKSKPKKSSKKSLKNENKLEVDNTKADVTPVEEMNVEQLLALGEKSTGVDFSTCKVDDLEDFSDSESDLSDFEEVQNADVLEPIIPEGGVNITLEGPSLFHKQKKKGFDWQAHIKRQLVRVRKDLQLLMHKVHVLCWIAHLRFLNITVNNSSLMEICASLVKSKNLYPTKYADLNYLEGILKWFHKNFELKRDVEDPLCTGGLLEELKYQVKKKEAFTNRAFILIFIILLRILGLKARIVVSFQVLPVKPSLLELYGDVIKARSEKLRKSTEKLEISEEKSENEKSTDLLKKENKSAPQNKKGKKAADSEPGPSGAEKSKKKPKGNVNMVESSDSEIESEHFKTPIKSSRKSVKLKQSKDEREDLKLNSKKSRKSKADAKKSVLSDEEEDNDFTPLSLSKKSNKKKTEKKPDEEPQKKKEGSDIWTEVYLEEEEKWISVDVPKQKIHCIGEIYVKATHPVTYIVACNNDHTLKDVTKRYVPNWHSDTRKRRVDEEWWNETMKPYLPSRTAQDKEEDEDINRQLMDKPLPSSIAEFKGHPLYVLKRHLLKFEAIYPPDAPTLGFVRGEPVYARECVHVLHSREMWYKQARLVRLKEEPYKIVKARPKYDKMTGEFKRDLPLELFGSWQTEDYIPPIATDGKVPRNEYGNVDLFKPCMLPIGTVHLQIPALNRIAKKLDIDCAPATVGFDFHSGGSHPVFDGFVVCEEFKDVLLDAWNKEIDESSKKEAEKRDKKVYGNWRRLIRGLLIREKLKIKYAFGENSDEDEPKSKTDKPSTSKISKN